MTIEELSEMKASADAYPPIPCDKCDGMEFHRGNCPLHLVWMDLRHKWKEAMDPRRAALLRVAVAAKALVVDCNTNNGNKIRKAIVRLEAAIIELEEVKT